jgi:hypothetical protein
MPLVRIDISKTASRDVSPMSATPFSDNRGRERAGK